MISRILKFFSDYKEPKEAPSKAAGGSGKIKMGKSAGISTEINLLGCTVDEAVARLDKYLDDAYIAGFHRSVSFTVKEPAH